MTRPDPKSLRDAANKTEQAQAARQAALAAEEKANAEKAAAESAESKADAALTAAGVNVNGAAGNGSNGNVIRRDWFHHSNGEFRSGVVAAIAVITFILVLLLLVGVYGLSNNKVSESRVEAINSVAIAGGNQATETKGKVSVMEGDLRHATEVGTGAAVKAESADTNAHNANENAKLALSKVTPTHSHVSRSQPARVNANANANAGAVSSATASASASAQTSASGKECRVYGKNKEVLADFLVASKNPKGIVVATGAECLKERDAFVAANNFRTTDRQVLTIN